ncbi:hypothetical protein F5888DRAFT_1150091 [Russula emetica]|nr:hypothetical protein F5888DRAFT_1150091 [Russula emetica]
MVLRLFWLGVIEATRPELCPSFFEVDLAHAILGFLGRDDTPSPLDPATLGSLRRGDTSSPLAPEILGVLSDDTPPPLIPEIPVVPGHHDTSPPLAPEILRALRRGDAPHPPPFPAHFSHHPAYPPPTQSFPVPSIPANTHLATPSRPISPTVQLSGTTPDHQNIAPVMPGFKPLPSRFAIQKGPRPFDRSWSYLDANEREPEVDLTDLRDEEFESRQETSRTSSHSHRPITGTVARIRACLA